MPDVRYWTNATRSLLRNVRQPGFAKDLLTAGLTTDHAPRARVAYFLDAYPEAESITVPMGDLGWRRSNMDPLERYVLAAIAIIRNAQTIFEIGTYDGTTTLALARACPHAEVYTLDLPPESADAATVDEEAANVSTGGLGARFQDTPEAARITQLYGDSRSFDFSPYRGKCDFVLVDAGHTYDCVSADTSTALQLIRRNGVIVWDDYIPGWPGVVHAVDALGLPVFRIESSGIAVFDRAKAESRPPPAIDLR